MESCLTLFKIRQAKKNYLALCILFLSSLAYSATVIETQAPPHLGNFVLSNSQQPGPLIGFGENILNKNEVHLTLFSDDYHGKNNHSTDIVPGFLYGITNNLSFLINLPISPSNKSGNMYSSGIEDSLVQFEYAYYTKQTGTYLDQATIVANMTIPTGSQQKQPPTGIGTPSYFLGGTFNRTGIYWFGFVSAGARVVPSHNGNQAGDQYLYEGGFGRNITTSLKNWIVAWMIEEDGQYSKRDFTNGSRNPDTGGNVIYVTPSLWFSATHLIFQLGAGAAVYQNLNGNQNRASYLLAGNVAYLFS